MAPIAPSDHMWKKLLAASIILCCTGFEACECDYTPERLPGISEDAVWAGGPDGGVWVECRMDATRNTDWCIAWSDQTGRMLARTDFVLRDSGRPVAENELRGAFFDGIYIHLSDGRLLEPLQFHLTEEDELPPAPIDPPREELPPS